MLTWRVDRRLRNSETERAKAAMIARSTDSSEFGESVSVVEYLTLLYELIVITYLSVDPGGVRCMVA